MQKKTFLTFFVAGGAVLLALTSPTLLHAFAADAFTHALAQANTSHGYQLTVPFPGQSNKVSGPRDYILNLYNFGLYAGGILAVLMIVIGGIQWTVSEVVTKKEDAMDRIRNALLGLALLLGAFVILQLINPVFNNLPEPGVGSLPPPGNYDNYNPGLCGNHVLDQNEACDLSAPGGSFCNGLICGSDCRCHYTAGH
jgi:hypothetical protein